MEVEENGNQSEDKERTRKLYEEEIKAIEVEQEGEKRKTVG